MSRTLIKGADIITLRPAHPHVEHLDVMIDGSIITELGDYVDPRGAEVVHLPGRIVMPGLVNAHFHSWQSALRHLGANWSLPEYLSRSHGELSHQVTPEDMRVGTAFGVLGQIDAGVTTIGDWCHNCLTHEHAEGAIAGLVDTGIRALFMHGIPHGVRDRPHNVQAFDRLLDGALADSELVTGAMAIMGPQLSSARTTLADLRAAREREVLAALHQSAGTPGPVWREVTRHNLWSPQVNIAHGTGLPDYFVRELSDLGVTFTTTPENELGQGHCAHVADVLVRHGASPSVGTDSDMMVSGDVRIAARVMLSNIRGAEHERSYAQTGLGSQTLRSSSWDALTWASTGGAKALGIGDRTGTIAPGMLADIAILDGRAINLSSGHDPTTAALHAHPGNVEAVMIGGEWRKRNHVLVGSHVEAVVDAATESGLRLARHLTDTRLRTRSRRKIVETMVGRSLRSQVAQGRKGDN